MYSRSSSGCKRLALSVLLSSTRYLLFEIPILIAADIVSSLAATEPNLNRPERNQAPEGSPVFGAVLQYVLCQWHSDALGRVSSTARRNASPPAGIDIGYSCCQSPESLPQRSHPLPPTTANPALCPRRPPAPYTPPL